MKDKKGWVSFRYHAFVGWKDQEMKILEFIRLWARTVPATDIFSKDIIERSGQKFQHLNNFAHLWSKMSIWRLAWWVSFPKVRNCQKKKLANFRNKICKLTLFVYIELSKHKRKQNIIYAKIKENKISYMSINKSNSQ